MPGLVGRTRYARTGDLRIAYEVRSPAVSRRPVLLLIQGLGLDRAGWGPALGRLQRRFRLVLVDNRGSGRSAAAGPFSVADMAADAVAVLDHARIGIAHVAARSSASRQRTAPLSGLDSHTGRVVASSPASSAWLTSGETWRAERAQLDAISVRTPPGSPSAVRPRIVRTF
jgi:3-oxoadipate enol-lactonase